MFKKVTITILIMCGFISSVNAGGMIVGSNPIIPIEEYKHSPSRSAIKPIVLIKPTYKNKSINLISMDEFLKVQGRNSIVIPETKVEKAPIVEETRAETKTRLDVKDINVSEVLIAYESDKNTLLSHEAKNSLEELAEQAKKEEMIIGIITYAAGDPSMARRVALLRANIIKNTLKGYGLDEGQIDVKSFGNQVNINQAKVFLAE